MGTINWAAAPTEEEKRQELVGRLSRFRKEVEKEGVVIKGVHYAGDPENRQALNEALQMAGRLSTTTFATWKDSSNQYHADVPVSDVDDALIAIGEKRSALITKEGQFAQQIMAGTVTDISTLDWSV